MQNIATARLRNPIPLSRFGVASARRVEPEGFEPSSKRLQHELSTCFFLRWFSTAGRRRTPYRQLRSCCLADATDHRADQLPML